MSSVRDLMHKEWALAVSAYLTAKADPQRGRPMSHDDPEVLRVWCESAEHVGIPHLILYDKCPTEFRERWTKRTGVQWRRCTWGTKWSTNDERFLQYLRVIDAMPDVEWWLFTDLTDVEFFRDPFALMTDDHALYIQSETSTIGANSWMQAHWIASYGKRWPDDNEPIYSAGMFGGHRDVVRPFIGRVLEELNGIHARWTGDPVHRNIVERFWCKHGCNGNMSALNKAARRWLEDTAKAWDAHGTHADMPAVCEVARNAHIITGHPLHTRFKDYEGRETGACVRHK